VANWLLKVPYVVMSILCCYVDPPRYDLKRSGPAEVLAESAKTKEETNDRLSKSQTDREEQN
jgi:hypothetical protein